MLHTWGRGVERSGSGTSTVSRSLAPEQLPWFRLHRNLHLKVKHILMHFTEPESTYEFIGQNQHFEDVSTKEKQEVCGAGGERERFFSFPRILPICDAKLNLVCYEHI